MKQGKYDVMSLGEELKKAIRGKQLSLKPSKIRDGVYYISDPTTIRDAFDIYFIVCDAITNCDATYEYHGSTLAVIND